MLVRQREAICDMHNDSPGSIEWFHIVVSVYGIWKLVFDEELRIHGFATIMVKRTNSHQELVCADGFRRLFCQVGHLQAVLVGPWSAAQEELQQWMIGA